jgi:short-subunit dehydrogenase
MNIVVNGGTRGIGRQVVFTLAGKGNNAIFVTGRNKELLADISSGYRNVFTMPLDISGIKDVSEEYVSEIRNKLGTVDIMINIAGQMIPKSFMEIDDDDARSMMETNFFGPATAIRLLVPLMHQESHIINISSMGGFQGSSKYPGLSYYSASKAAIACLTECLAVELKQYGIKVNCLALGSVQTEMLSEAFPGYVAPVSPEEMGEYIADFALTGQRFYNGKILPVAVTNP